jgi:Amt family ammonium transporter
LKLAYDDSLDAFGVHGVGGIVGTLLAGLFAQKIVNAAGNNGLFFGNPAQLFVQLAGVLAITAYSVIITLVILKVVDRVIGLRVEDEEEVVGLDITQHEESAYTLLD